MEKTFFLQQSSALTILILSSFLFAFIGIFYSRKYRGSSNYLTAGGKIGTLSLTTSLVASALGAWILFGPASAATWGGIGAVIGYALGTAFPMIALIFLGKKIRQAFPKGITFTQYIFYKIGKKLFKFIIFLSIFYMFIFPYVLAHSLLPHFSCFGPRLACFWGRGPFFGPSGIK